MRDARANADTSEVTIKEILPEWISLLIIVLAIIPLFMPAGSASIVGYIIYFTLLGIAAAVNGAYSVIGAFRNLMRVNVDKWQ